MTSATFFSPDDASIALAFQRAMSELHKIAYQRPRHWRKGLEAAEAYMVSLFSGSLRFAEPKLNPNYRDLTRKLFAAACDAFGLDDTSNKLPGQRRHWYSSVAKDVTSSGASRKTRDRRGWRH